MVYGLYGHPLEGEPASDESNSWKPYLNIIPATSGAEFWRLQ